MNSMKLSRLIRHPQLGRFLVTALCLAGVLMLVPSVAAGKARWSLRGAGWGHGIGLSQYGAHGYARRGTGYRDILGHYYTGTEIQRRNETLVRVLLQPNRSVITFTGATRAGERPLESESVYRATRSGESVVLRSSTGRRLATYPDVMTVTGGDTFRLLGRAGNGVTSGIYRGSLDVRPAAATGLNAINTLPLESYIQGVVPAEIPPIWHPQALAAQAVAARSYALVTNVNGKGFEQYPDTRSQMYRGFGAETPSTNNAVANTRGEVVTYAGRVAVTYFFSTSGGYTENVENVFRGSDAKPWLKGVRDPYDTSSPYHRWGPYAFTTRKLGARLGNYVRGRFRGLDVLQRGVSPRVVKARVRGTGGSLTVTGAQLRSRLGLRDTWFFLRRVTTDSGGAVARTSSGTRELAQIEGVVEPAAGRFVKLQRRRGGRWRPVANVPLFPHGSGASYSYHVAKSGVYRVRSSWAAGPPIEVSP